MLCRGPIVGVVVQNAEAMPLRNGSDDEVGRREAMMTGPGELALKVDRAALDGRVHVRMRSASCRRSLALVSLSMRNSAAFSRAPRITTSPNATFSSPRHDYELVAAVTGQPHEWVAPRGSL